MYVNGVQVSTSNTVTISPLDLKPALNYMGRSQTSNTLLNGTIDDFRIYNYAMTATQVAQLPGVLSDVKKVDFKTGLSLYPQPATDVLHINHPVKLANSLSTLSVFTMDGRTVLSSIAANIDEKGLDVSNIPTGIYLLKWTNGDETLVKRFVVKH